jgi:Ca-activated chloride channel homolog
VSGRHRSPSRGRTAAAVAAALAVVAVAAGLRFGFAMVADRGCDGTVRMSVAAAADIAPSVRAAAQGLAGGKAGGNGSCLAIDVRAAEPSDVAAAVSRQQRTSLSGVGAASGTSAVPDVWIPDSTSWLVRLRAAVPGLTVGTEGSVALSPVVMAMPEPVEAALGWRGKTPGYGDLLRQVTTSTTLRAGTAEPTRDAAGLSGLLALEGAAASSGPDDPGALSAVLHALAAGRSALREDVLQQFPQAGDDASVAGALGLAPLSEHDVIAYDAASPAVRLSALYLQPAPAPLDYPFVVMPNAGSAQTAAAHTLYRALRTAGFRDRLANAGFRGPAGRDGKPPAAPPGAPSSVAVPAGRGRAAAAAPDAATINRAIAGWAAVVAPARLLAVLDASSSMRAPAGRAGGRSRMQATIETARDGLALFSDDWQVGLWQFPAGAPGSHRELVRIGPLTDTRDDVRRALDRLTPAGADAGLYRTVLDAYRQVQNGWQAGRVNSVLILTDGVGGAPGSGDLSLSDLLAKLDAAKDPARPVQVVVVGIGDAVDRAPLDQITRAVGGGVFVATDPAQIGDVFNQAVSLRIAAPR